MKSDIGGLFAYFRSLTLESSTRPSNLPGVLVDRNVKEDGVEGAVVEAEAVVALVAALVAVAVAVATVEVAAEAGAEACRVLQGSQTNSQSWLNSDMVTINT